MGLVQSELWIIFLLRIFEKSALWFMRRSNSR